MGRLPCERGPPFTQVLTDTGVAFHAQSRTYTHVLRINISVGSLSRRANKKLLEEDFFYALLDFIF